MRSAPSSSRSQAPPVEAAAPVASASEAATRATASTSPARNRGESVLALRAGGFKKQPSLDAPGGEPYTHARIGWAKKEMITTSYSRHLPTALNVYSMSIFGLIFACIFGILVLFGCMLGGPDARPKWIEPFVDMLGLDDDRLLDRNRPASADGKEGLPSREDRLVVMADRGS